MTRLRELSKKINNLPLNVGDSVDSVLAPSLGAELGAKHLWFLFHSPRSFAPIPTALLQMINRLFLPDLALDWPSILERQAHIFQVQLGQRLHNLRPLVCNLSRFLFRELQLDISIDVAIIVRRNSNKRRTTRCRQSTQTTRDRGVISWFVGERASFTHWKGKERFEWKLSELAWLPCGGNQAVISANKKQEEHSLCSWTLRQLRSTERDL